TGRAFLKGFEGLERRRSPLRTGAISGFLYLLQPKFNNSNEKPLWKRCFTPKQSPLKRASASQSEACSQPSVARLPQSPLEKGFTPKLIREGCREGNRATERSGVASKPSLREGAA
ncbi:hypothetical protein B6U71_01385, partial [Euryarchaeota archaeon ex4484_178]